MLHRTEGGANLSLGFSIAFSLFSYPLTQRDIWAPTTATTTSSTTQAERADSCTRARTQARTIRTRENENRKDGKEVGVDFSATTKTLILLPVCAHCHLGLPQMAIQCHPAPYASTRARTHARTRALTHALPHTHVLRTSGRSNFWQKTSV